MKPKTVKEAYKEACVAHFKLWALAGVLQPDKGIEAVTLNHLGLLLEGVSIELDEALGVLRDAIGWKASDWDRTFSQYGGNKGYYHTEQEGDDDDQQ